jgi:hypothetical protein
MFLIMLSSVPDVIGLQRNIASLLKHRVHTHDDRYPRSKEWTRSRGLPGAGAAQASHRMPPTEALRGRRYWAGDVGATRRTV